MSKTKLKPLGENVLIQPSKIDKKTDTGIYLPADIKEEKSQAGKVIAVGDHKGIKVKVGQLVIFRPFSGTQVKLDETEYLLTNYENILAIVL